MFLHILGDRVSCAHHVRQGKPVPEELPSSEKIYRHFTFPVNNGFECKDCGVWSHDLLSLVTQPCSRAGRLESGLPLDPASKGTEPKLSEHHPKDATNTPDGPGVSTGGSSDSAVMSNPNLGHCSAGEGASVLKDQVCAPEQPEPEDSVEDIDRLLAECVLEEDNLALQLKEFDELESEQKELDEQLRQLEIVEQDRRSLINSTVPACSHTAPSSSLVRHPCDAQCNPYVCMFYKFSWMCMMIICCSSKIRHQRGHHVDFADGFPVHAYHSGGHACAVMSTLFAPQAEA